MKSVTQADEDFITATSCIFDNFSDPIVLVSTDSRILYVNNSLAKLIGVRRPDALKERYYDEVRAPVFENEETIQCWIEQDQQVLNSPEKNLCMLEIHPQEINCPYTVKKNAILNKEERIIGILHHIKYLEMYRPNDFIKGRLPGSLLLNKPDELFTEKECEIIFLKLQGMTCKMIGDMLYRSERTVENSMYNIYQKAGVGNSTDFEEFCEKRNLHRYLPKRFINPERHSFSGSFQVEDEDEDEAVI